MAKTRPRLLRNPRGNSQQQNNWRGLCNGALADNSTMVLSGDGVYGVLVNPTTTPGITIIKDANGGLAVNLDPNGGLSNTTGVGTFPGLFLQGFRSVSGAPGSPSDGWCWYDTLNKVFSVRQAGQIVTGVGVIFVSYTTSAAVGNSIVETAFSTDTYSLPANYLATPGRVIRVTEWGRYQASGATTLTLRFYMGATVIIDFGAVAIPAVGTTRAWEADFTLICETTGAGGTIRCRGTLTFLFNGTKTVVNVNATALNTTAAQAVKMTAQWSVANAADSVIRVGQLVESCG